MDLPLYTTMSRTHPSDIGSTAYQMFDLAVVLEQVMRQSGPGVVSADSAQPEKWSNIH